MTDLESGGKAEDERPPVLRRWSQLYAIVLGALAVGVAAMTALGWIYR